MLQFTEELFATRSHKGFACGKKEIATEALKRRN
jgi:hypothetical protein